MSLPAQSPVGRYVIDSPLGKGGMGEVYLAWDPELERKVAIKFLSAEFADDADKLARFFQEAKAASALNHPNILTVYEIGRHEESHFIVTEYIDGRTLTPYVESEKPNLRGLLEIAIQISSALAAAHEAGIIHRDIKPGNIMIRKDRIVKVLDFGLAKLTKLTNESEFDSEAATLAKVTTVPGMLLGTPSYMSPEQARARELDSRTDIFSLGIVIYEMIAGVKPFEGESYADIMGAILKDSPPPLEKFVRNTPDELEHIVERTLRKDPDARYQNIKDLLIDLKDLRDHLKFEEKLSHNTLSSIRKSIHGTNTDPAQETVAIEPETQFIKLRPLAIPLAVVVLALVASAFGAYWFFSAGGNKSNESRANTKTTDLVSWNSAPGELSSIGRFSPDGKMIAFASSRPGSKDIWIKQTADGGAIQITKDSFTNKDPVWSPTGTEIAYFSDKGNNTSTQSNATGIWRVPALGGDAISVGAIEDGSSQLIYWAPSDRIFYESARNLFAMDVKTGKSVKLTNLSSDKTSAQLFCVSKDEKQIAFVRTEGDSRQIMVADISGNAARKLTKVDQTIASMVWDSANDSIVFSMMVDGTFQVFMIATDGSAPEQVTFGDRNSQVVDVSADGKSILFGSTKEESNLWKTDVQSKTEATVASGIDAELWPDLSRENGKLAFQSVKNLSQGNKLLSSTILMKTVDKQDQPSLLVENGFLPVWAPDGNSLAFMRMEGTTAEIWTVKGPGAQPLKVASGGIPAISYSVSPYNRVQSRDFDWSPDSGRIAYVSNRDGKANVWSAAADGSGDVKLTDNSSAEIFVYCPIWSADGNRLAYYTKSKSSDADGKSVFTFWIYDSDEKKSEKVYETTRLSRLVDWTESDQGLLIVSADAFSGLPPSVFLSKISSTDGSITQIAELEKSYYYNIHLSQDKTRIAYVANRDGIDDVWTISAGGGGAEKVTNNNDANLYFSSLSWSADSKAVFFGKQTRYSLLSMITNFQE